MTEVIFWLVKSFGRGKKKTAHFVILAEVVKRDSDFIFSFSISLNPREKTYKDHIFHLDLPFILFFSESFKTALEIFVFSNRVVLNVGYQS